MVPSSTAPAHDVELRALMAHVPTSVAVVTGFDGARPHGLAVGTFTSISLDPPLVGFFVTHTSRSWPEIRSTGRFCVNVLAHHQGNVSRAFSRSGSDKFDGVAWRPSRAGTGVVLDDVVVVVECDIEREETIGDHLLVVGHVVDGALVNEMDPLAFHRGGFPRLQAVPLGRG